MITLPPFGQQSGSDTSKKLIKLPPLNIPKPPVSIPEIPSAIRNFGGTMQTLSELQESPLNLQAKISEAPKAIYESIKSSIINEGQAIKDYFSGISPIGITRFPGTAESLNLVSKTAGLVLSPVTALFEGANKVPVLGSISKLISLPFSAAGEGSALVYKKTFKKAVDAIPDNVISKEYKEKLNLAGEEISALAGQIALGKVVDIGLKSKKYAELKSKFGETDANTIVSKAQEISKQKETAQPITQVTTGITRNEVGQIKLPTFGTEITQPKITPVEVRPLELAETQPELKTSKLAESIQTKAIEERLTSGFEDLPQHEVLNMRAQAQRAENLLNLEPERARKIALGEERPPVDTTAEAIATAVENKAFLDGDVNTIRELATSKLIGETTAIAQRLRTLAERDPESPVGAIIELKKAREEVISKKYNTKKIKSEEIAKAKKEINKISATKETWSSFIKSLEC